MAEMELNDEIINKIKVVSTHLAKKLMGKDLIKVILYGSCARGDYAQDSDIDIVLITSGDRIEVKK